MSDKCLTELEWKKFAKGRGLKDAALVKALAALEGARTAPSRLQSLDELGKQIDALHNVHKSDRDVASHLEDIEKAAARARKLAELEVKQTARKTADAAGEDEGEESPALLSSRMAPLLRAVRKGEPLPAMIALCGKECAVLISRKAIGVPQRKVLQAALGASGGLKFIGGECLWENNAHTFVVTSQASGLAKKIGAALLGQTRMRVKVRVRGADPNDVDDDGEPPVEDEDEVSAEAGHQDPAEDESARFNARLALLVPRVKEAMVAEGPGAVELKLKVSESGLAARKKAFARAQELLDDVEALLAAVPRAAPRGLPDPDGVLADWQACRAAAIASLKDVAGKVAAARHASSAKAILEIQAVIKNLTAAPSTLRQVHELQRWLGDDDVVDDVCALAEDVRTPLLASLQRLQGRLASTGQEAAS